MRNPRKSASRAGGTRNAIESALAFDDCVTCGERIAYVDGQRDKDDRIIGGSIVHVELSPTVHPARARRAA